MHLLRVLVLIGSYTILLGFACVIIVILLTNSSLLTRNIAVLLFLWAVGPIFIWIFRDKLQRIRDWVRGR